MKLCILAILLSIAFSLQGQDKCFSDCWSRFENSALPFPQKNQEIINQLLGCNAPDFETTVISGGKISLHSLRGKVVVLNFWFTTCPPCIVELPGLNKLVDEFGKSDSVIFLAIGRNTRDEILDFIKKRPFGYKQAISSKSLEQAYCMLSGWPMNMVLDKKGVVRFIKAGGPVPGNGNELMLYNEMKPIITRYLSN